MGDVLFYARFRVSSHQSKKNGRPIYKSQASGRPFLGKTAELLQAEREMLVNIMRAKDGAAPITAPINAKFTFWFHENKFWTKAGTRNKKLPDISNLYELPQDILQKAGVIFDDNLIESHDGSRRLPHKDGTFLEIELTSFEG